MDEITKTNLSADLSSVLERYGQTSAVIIVKDSREVNTISLQGSAEQNPEFMANLGMHVNIVCQDHITLNATGGFKMPLGDKIIKP